MANFRTAGVYSAMKKAQKERPYANGKPTCSNTAQNKGRAGKPEK